jgi:hypothetical protein
MTIRWSLRAAKQLQALPHPRRTLVQTMRLWLKLVNPTWL